MPPLQFSVHQSTTAFGHIAKARMVVDAGLIFSFVSYVSLVNGEHSFFFFEKTQEILRFISLDRKSLVKTS